MRVEFHRSIKLEFHGAKVSSDGGLLVYRELDEALRLTEMARKALADIPTGDNIQHDLPALLRQSVYGRLAGYEDTNDADRVHVAPTMRMPVGGGAPFSRVRPLRCAGLRSTGAGQTNTVGVTYELVSTGGKAL